MIHSRLNSELSHATSALVRVFGSITHSLMSPSLALLAWLLMDDGWQQQPNGPPTKQSAKPRFHHNRFNFDNEDCSIDPPFGNCRRFNFRFRSPHSCRRKGPNRKSVSPNICHPSQSTEKHHIHTSVCRNTKIDDKFRIEIHCANKKSDIKIIHTTRLTFFVSTFWFLFWLERSIDNHRWLNNLLHNNRIEIIYKYTLYLRHTRLSQMEATWK